MTPYAQSGQEWSARVTQRGGPPVPPPVPQTHPTRPTLKQREHKILHWLIAAAICWFSGVGVLVLPIIAIGFYQDWKASRR